MKFCRLNTLGTSNDAVSFTNRMANVDKKKKSAHNIMKSPKDIKPYFSMTAQPTYDLK